LAPFLTGCDSENGDTHVAVFDDVFSDAGSTPAASTTYLLGLQEVTRSHHRRLHNISTLAARIEQPNGVGNPLHRSASIGQRFTQQRPLGHDVGVHQDFR
jgi:hypothetical protein